VGVSCNVDIVDCFSVSYDSRVLAHIMTRSFPCLWKYITLDQRFCICFPNILGRGLQIYLHPLLGSDEVKGDSWQLVTAIRDEGDDGLILCE
jgi:hypothetical protein